MAHCVCVYVRVCMCVCVFLYARLEGGWAGDTNQEEAQRRAAKAKQKDILGGGE